MRQPDDTGTDLVALMTGAAGGDLDAAGSLTVRIVGYSGPSGASRPASAIRFMVSTRRRELRRVDRRGSSTATRQPGGPGLKVVPVETTVDGEYRGREQPLPARLVRRRRARARRSIPRGPSPCPAWICPTTPGERVPGARRPKRCRERRPRAGALSRSRRRGRGATRRRARPHRRARGPSAWIFVSAAFDGARGRLEQRPLRCCPGAGPPIVASRPRGGRPARRRALVPVSPGRTAFNGKLEGPGSLRVRRPLASWDFSLEIGTRPHPATPREMPSTAARQHADARGHRAQLGTAPRSTAATRPRSTLRSSSTTTTSRTRAGSRTFELRVPEAWRAASTPLGCERARTRTGVPFFVRPPRGESRFVDRVSRADAESYLAYANEHAADRRIPSPSTRLRTLRLLRSPRIASRSTVPLLGLYDSHRDGVGCLLLVAPPADRQHASAATTCRSSAGPPVPRRPPPRRLARREGLRRGRGHRRGPPRRGPRAARRYRVVLTGSHPEYWTSRMLDALAALPGRRRPAHVPRRQRLLLGDVDRSGAAARDRGPSRPAGNRHLARRSRARTSTRRPASPAGCGATAAGRRSGSSASAWPPRASTARCPTNARPAAADPRAAWIFAGVRRERDRRPRARRWAVPSASRSTASITLSVRRRTRSCSPSARGFSDFYQHVVEEVPSSDSQQGGTVSPFVRADMVFFERPPAVRSSRRARSPGAARSHTTATTTPSRGSPRTSCAASPIRSRSAPCLPERGGLRGERAGDRHQAGFPDSFLFPALRAARAGDHERPLEGRVPPAVRAGALPLLQPLAHDGPPGARTARTGGTDRTVQGSGDVRP